MSVEQPARDRGNSVRVAFHEARGVGRIVLGGPFGERADAASFVLLDRFADAGGRIVETAHSYADGAGERQLGRWLSGGPQDMVCITKVGHPAPGSCRVDVDRLVEEIELSIERLQVDSLDVVLLHRDDRSLTVEDELAPLLAAQEQGLVRALGVANWQAERIAQAIRSCGPHRLAAASSHVSLAVPRIPLWPGVVNADRALLDLHAREGLPLLSWSANARGWFASDRASDSRIDEDSRRTFATATNERRRASCHAVAQRTGARPAVVALAWTLRTFPFVLPTVGPRSAGELADSLAAASLTLSPRDLSGLTEELP